MPPLQVGDTFIESGSILTSLNTTLGRLTYGFSLIRNEQMDLQLKAGLHVVKSKADIQLTGEVCNQGTTPMTPPGCPSAISGQEAEDVTAPLPHLGGSLRYAITPSLALNFQVIGFALKINSIDGSIIEVDSDLYWQPWRHFGFGTGLRYFKTSVKAQSNRLNGKFEYGYLGPVIYVRSTF